MIFVYKIPLCDVVEPPDFEELVALYQSLIERDPLRQILEFPIDSVHLEHVRRCVRTLAPVIPEHGSALCMFNCSLSCMLRPLQSREDCGRWSL